MSHLEEYEYLLKRSKRFYETAIMQLERGFYDLAAFSLEQSLQLYLKAALLKKGVEFPRTRRIRRLLELLYEITGRGDIEKILDELALELALFEDIYITAGYIPRDYRKEEVLKLKNAVEEVMGAVRKIID